MLNYIWAAMLLIGVVYGAFTGKLEQVSDAALSSAGEAVSLCITMVGVMCVWVGLMEIAKKAGLIDSMTKSLRPVISFLFPRLPKEHPAEAYISTNIIANILGLGWAATPAGLKAMEELSKLEEERSDAGRVIRPNKLKTSEKGIASNEMCTFLVINISSLQLIPVNIIAYRSQYGSVSPTAFIGPGLIATLISTVVAVLFCKLMCAKRKNVSK